MPVVLRASMSSCALTGLGQRVGAADHGAQLPGRDQVEQLPHRLRQQLGPRHAVREPEADHRPAALQEPSGVHGLWWFTPSHAEEHQPPEGRQRFQALVERRAADHLEHHVDLASVRLLDRSLHVGCARIDRDVCAKVERQLSLLVAGRGGDHAPGAPALRDLDRQAPDPARGRVHDDTLAFSEVRTGAQQVPGRGSLQDDRQRLAVVDPVGHVKCEQRCRQDALGVAATPPTSATTRLPSGVVPTTSAPGIIGSSAAAR